jgi:hypothetical protein
MKVLSGFEQQTTHSHSHEAAEARDGMKRHFKRVEE